MSIAGTYEITTKTPMGDQKSTLTIVVDGDTFTGSNVGATGSLDITDGKISGSSITWSNKVTTPIPMTLDCKAIIDGDAISGSVTAGMFGTFSVHGKRVG